MKNNEISIRDDNYIFAFNHFDTVIYGDKYCYFELSKVVPNKTPLFKISFNTDFNSCEKLVSLLDEAGLLRFYQDIFKGVDYKMIDIIMNVYNYLESSIKLDSCNIEIIGYICGMEYTVSKNLSRRLYLMTHFDAGVEAFSVSAVFDNLLLIDFLGFHQFKELFDLDPTLSFQIYSSNWRVDEEWDVHINTEFVTLLFSKSLAQKMVSREYLYNVRHMGSAPFQYLDFKTCDFITLGTTDGTRSTDSRIMLKLALLSGVGFVRVKDVDIDTRAVMFEIPTE